MISKTLYVFISTEVSTSYNGQHDVPEPEEDEDLLIDNVHTENTESVKVLDCSGASILLKSAFCHPGEDAGHGVNPVLWVLAGEAEYLQAVLREGVPEEGVGQADLKDDIDQIEEFTEIELQRPHSMLHSVIPSLLHVIRELLDLLGSQVRVKGQRKVEAIDEVVKFFALHHFPNPVRDVKHNGL